MPVRDDDDPPHSRPWDQGSRDDDDDRPRRRRERDWDDDDDYRPRRRGRSEASNGLATAGMILGIISLCMGPVAGIAAVICAGIALGRPGGRTPAVTGLVLGAIGTLITPFVMIGLLLPAVQKVRSTAARMADQNNMKQIALGARFQADAHGSCMSGPYTRDQVGTIQRGLSWRVGVLPYIEQDRVYSQFDLSQPWDSAKNRPASNTTIKTFTTPFNGPEEPGVNTPYRVFYGGGALFEADGTPVDIGRVPDGLSNTVLMVHATEQVPWAEPREFRYSANAPLPKLGHPGLRGGFNVVMADGSVRFVSDKVSERTLRNAITKDDGQQLGADW